MAPRLAVKGTFEFYSKANVPDELKEFAKKMTGMDMLTSILKAKLTKTGANNRCFIANFKTASGKSTLMISSLYESFIKETNRAICCSQPRIVLVTANPADIQQWNPSYRYGYELEKLSSVEHVTSPLKSKITFCTTQILANHLTSLINATDSTKQKRLLNKYLLIVIDEVHTLDIAMLQLLQYAKRTIEKFGDNMACPLFIFSSATLNIEQIADYFNIDLSNPLNCGIIQGVGNFPVEDIYLSKEQIENAIENEIKLKNIGYGGVIAQYWVENIYPKVWNSTATFNNIQCRDTLVFIPNTLQFETFAAVAMKQVKEPSFMVRRGITFESIKQWRNKFRNQRRILFIGYSTGYSSGADEIISFPIDQDEEAVKNETKVWLATVTLETGKTLYLLAFVIDSGLDNVMISNPLTSSSLKVIAANTGQVTQRIGRVGRNASGTSVHFYTKETFNKFDKNDVPATVNTQSLSNLFLLSSVNIPDYSYVNLFNMNDYLYPASMDVVLASCQDMIKSGFLTINSQLVSFVSKRNLTDVWITIAKYLHENQNVSLLLALIIAHKYWMKIANKFGFLLTVSSPFTLDDIKDVCDYTEFLSNKNPSTSVIDTIRSVRPIIEVTKYMSNYSAFLNIN